jgi:hypothetical protein
MHSDLSNKSDSYFLPRPSLPVRLLASFGFLIVVGFFSVTFLMGSFNLWTQEAYIGSILTGIIGFLAFLAFLAYVSSSGRVELTKSGIKFSRAIRNEEISWQQIVSVEIEEPPPLWFQAISVLIPGGTLRHYTLLSVSAKLKADSPDVSKVRVYSGTESDCRDIIEKMKRRGLRSDIPLHQI